MTGDHFAMFAGEIAVSVQCPTVNRAFVAVLPSQIYPRQKHLPCATQGDIAGESAPDPEN